MSQQGTVYWQEPSGQAAAGSEILGPIRQNNQDVSLTIDQITSKETARAIAQEGSIMAAVMAEVQRAQAVEAALGSQLSGNEKTANKNQPNGYAGLDGSNNLMVSGLLAGSYLLGNGNLAGSIPNAGPGVNFLIGWNYETGNGEVDFFNAYYSNASGTSPAYVFYQYINSTTAIPIAGISKQGRFTANSLEIYGSGQVDGGLIVGAGLTYAQNIGSSTDIQAFFTSASGLVAEIRGIGKAAANYIFLVPSASGSDVGIGVDGSDANSSLDIFAKGTGTVNILSGLKLTNLPTSPGPAGSGIVWNNNNFLAIS